MILATYLVVYYLLPKIFFEKKQYAKFFIFLILIIIAATFAEKFIIISSLMEWALQPISEVQYYWLTGLHPFRKSFSLLAILGSASFFQFFKMYADQEKKKNELIQEKLETQYSFLKAQVNPHFMFNALNNIYSMAVQESQTEIAKGIENLSGIMQYLTYESNAKKVPLLKEIKLIQDYIAIEELRFDDTDDTVISISLDGDMKEKEIAPVILLPLVENAFKHGIKPKQKCLVSIKIKVNQNELECSIKNTVFDFKMKEIESHGVGLNNVKKRLNLVYPDQYEFNAKRENAYYTTNLKINLI